MNTFPTTSWIHKAMASVSQEAAKNLSATHNPFVSPKIKVNNDSVATPEAISVISDHTSRSSSSSTSSRKTPNPKTPQEEVKRSATRKTAKTLIDLSNKDTRVKVVIDITGVETNVEDMAPGTPLEMIKSNHSLYFRYDPRGWSGSGLPDGYCEDCRCPLSYCSETVFGKLSFKMADAIIEKQYWHSFGPNEVRDLFKEEYNKLLHFKLLWNNIEHKAVHPYEIPFCVKYGSLSKLWKKVEVRNRKKDESNQWKEMKDDYDLSTTEWDVFRKKYCCTSQPDDGDEEDDGIDKDQGEEVKASKKACRTMVEQKADVSPKFQRIKKKLKMSSAD